MNTAINHLGVDDGTPAELQTMIADSVERLFAKENVKIVWDHEVVEYLGSDPKPPMPASVVAEPSRSCSATTRFINSRCQVLSMPPVTRLCSLMLCIA